jgi:TolA-binding protein
MRIEFRHFIHLVFTGTLLSAASVASAQPERLSPVVDLERGIYFFEQGLLETSIQHLERFSRVSPPDLLERADFYLALARGYSDSVNVAQYFEHYMRSYPDSPHTVELLLESAQRNNLSHKHRNALIYYRRVLEKELRPSDEVRIRYWSAESRLATGDTTQALADLLYVADKFPKSEWAPKALYSRGRLLLAKKELRDATPAFELLRSRYPNDELTRRIGNALGESYYQQARYADAIKAFNEAIPYLTEDQKARAAFLIGESYNMLGDYENASVFYLRFINLKKDSPADVRAARYGLGWVYHRQRIYHWAAESFAKAADGTDSLAQKALYYQAANEKMAGRYDLAMKTFEKFSKTFTAGIWAERSNYEWAYTSFEYGDYEKTIEIALKMVRAQQKMREPGKMFQLLGEAYFANGEYTRAHQAFEQAEKTVSLPPDAKYTTRFQRAWLLYQNGAYEQAQPAFYRLWSENPKHSKAAEALFWSADAYFSMEDWRSAASQFELFLEKYPGHKFSGAARYSIGWSYFKTRDYDLSVAAYQAFLDAYKPPPMALFPYDIDTRLRMGDAYYAMSNYEKALEAYELVADAEEGADYALFQMANCYYRSGKSYEAVTTFRELLERFPESRLREQALYNVAYVYFLMGNYDQAVAEFDQLIAKYPGTNWAARAQYNIGDAWYNAKKYDAALSAYRNVLAMFPASEYIIEAVNGIQYAQLASGGADSSSAVLEKFLAENPKSGTADRLKYRQAEQKLQAGDFEGAVAAFRDYLRVTNVERMVPEALYNLADAYVQMGKTKNAIETWTEIIDRHGKSDKAEPALLNRAKAELQSGNAAAAKASFQKLREMNGKLVLEAWIGLGDLALLEKRADDARTSFTKALALNAKSDAGRLGLAKLDIQEKKYTDALPVLQKVAALSTEAGAEAQYYIGVLYRDQQKKEEAIQAFLKTKVLFETYTDWVARALLETARIQLSQNQPGPAAILLRQIVDLYAQTDAAPLAAKLLKEISG